MEQYIPKDALVAEIKRRKDICKKVIWDLRTQENKDYYQGKVEAYSEMAELIDTLEVKEVDLEKEVVNWRHNHFHGRRDKDASGEYLERISQLELAKHFFELGLKAQKKE